MIFIPTVDSIVKQFTKVSEKLDSLIMNNTRAIEVNTQVINKLIENSTECKTEIDRAKVIKKNIDNIFNA
jgi:hypothetical protein